MEFITGVHSSTSDLITELKRIHGFVSFGIGEQLLWPTSLPANFKVGSEVPLAYFGESNVGKLKTLYRKGLGYRYGRSMQSIAGLHYNFSMSDDFWKELAKEESFKGPLKEFKSDKYFSLIRNYRRYSWILIYLFGSSSIVHKSFLEGKDHELELLDCQGCDDTYYTKWGTSLRMGGLGYTSSAQEGIAICYNKLKTYVETLEQARQESYPSYEKIGTDEDGTLRQLNTNLLQIDNEFYSTIRPKNIAKSKESALKALHERGVEYIEVRLIDINQDSSIGISKSQIEFLHIFLLWCLTKESPFISSEECSEINSNFNQIVSFGRKPSLNLLRNNTKVSREKYLEDCFSEMSLFTDLLSQRDISYKSSFKEQQSKIYNLELLPSQIVINEARKKGMLNYYIELAQKYKKELLSFEYCPDYFQKLALDSVLKEKKMVENDKLSFHEFLTQYFQDIKIRGL